MHGEVPARSITAFFGTACGNGMYAARRETRSALNWSGTATLQASSHWRHPVQSASSTNRGLRRIPTWKAPFPFRRMPSTSE